VGVRPNGLVGQARQVEHGLVGLVRPPVVIREPVVDLREPVGVDGLERPGDRAVEHPAAPHRQALVGHVARQAVGERADGLAAARLRIEELEAHQLAEMRIRLAVPHGAEERERHLLPDHRGGLEEAPGLLRQPVDPGEEHLLNRVGHGGAHGGVDRPLDHPRQLLQEEGVPLGLLENDLGNPVGHRVGSAERADDAQAVLPGQRRKRDLGDVRAVHPGGPVAWPIGHDAHRRRSGRAVHQRGQALFRRGVDPVEVLDDEQAWPPARPLQHELAQGLEGPHLDRRRGKRGERLRALRDAEEAEEIGRRAGGLDPDFLEPSPDLLGDGVWAVALGDAEVGSEDIQDREIGNGAGVGLAAPFQVGDPPLGLAEEPLAELVEQARLPDAGLAEQTDDLAVAAQCILEPAPQEAELAGPAHERGRTPPETRAQSLRDDEPVDAPTRCLTAPQGGEIEVAREERRRGLFHEDLARFGESEERVEHGPRLALAVQVDLGPASGAPDEHPSDGDPRADRDAGRLSSSRALRRLVDGRRGQRGSLRRVLDRFEAESRDDPRGAHLLDPAPERLDLLDHGLERAARAEPGIGIGRRDEYTPQEREAAAFPSNRERRDGPDGGGLEARAPAAPPPRPEPCRRRAPGGPAAPRAAASPRVARSPRAPGRAWPCGTGACPGRCPGARQPG
jgi:hypothetical protein